MFGVFPIATPQFGDAINEPGAHTKRYRRVIAANCRTRTCAVTFPPDVEIYSLQDALIFNETTISFIVTCPPGYTCPPGMFPKVVTFPPGTFVLPDPYVNPGFPIVLQLQGCQSNVTLTLPANATQAEINAAGQAIIAEVARQQAECDSIVNPPTPNPSPFFTNEVRYSSVTCDECETINYTGNLPWYISLDRANSRLVLAVGFIAAPTQAAANTQAQSLLDFFKTESIASGQLVCVSCTISTASPLPDGEVGVDYSQALSVTGTFTSTTWEIVSGSLPDGLSLSSAGLISGTPTTEETQIFTVKATSGLQCCEKEFEIEIAAAILCPSFNQAVALSENAGPGNSYYGDVGGVNPRIIFSARQGATSIVSAVDADLLSEVATSGNYAAGIVSICYVPTANVVLVAEANNGTVDVLNAVTLASTASIVVDAGIINVLDMTYDSVNDRVYMIWQDNPAADGGTLSAFNGTSLASAGSVALSADAADTPDRVAFCIGTNKIYVGMFNATPNLRLQIYQGGTLTPFGTFALGDDALETAANTPMACSNGKVWVQVSDINTGDESLLIIDSSTDLLILSIAYGSGITQRGLCWVTGKNQMFTKVESTVRIIDVDSNSEVCNLPLNTVSDRGIVADPDTDNVFASGVAAEMDIYSYV
jgi:hypothetical protein